MIIYIASPYTAHADKQAAVNAQIDAFAALRDYEFLIDRIRALRVTPMTMHETCTGTPCVATVSLSVDTLRQIRVLLGCIQRPTVAYDKDALTMAQAAVGYCGEMAAQIEAMLPKDQLWNDSE